MEKSEKHPPKDSQWTFLSNHAHVLICISRHPELILRDVADLVGITERAVHKIIKDLEEAKIITRKRDGRQNIYTLHTKEKLRHPLESHRAIHDLLKAIDH